MLPKGAQYHPNFISLEEENSFLNLIDKNTWSDDLKRRVQHYGYRYDYKTRRLSSSDFLEPLPKWLTPIITRLKQRGYFQHAPNQVIINEYLPGQGIAPHIDCEACFDNTIASLSLGAIVKSGV